MQRYELLWDHDYWVKYGPWLAAPRDPALFSAPEKIVVRQTGDSLIATIIGPGFVIRNNMHIILPREGFNLRYALGIINSRLMDFVYTMFNPEKGEALAEVKKYHVEQLPLRPFEEDPSRGEKIAVLVGRVLEISAQKRLERNPQARSALEQQVRGLLANIDLLVDDLYGLTKDDRGVVERVSSPRHFDRA